MGPPGYADGSMLHRTQRPPLFLRPGWQLAAVTLLMSAFELLTKYGADHAPQDTFFARWGFAAVGSIWTWIGTLVAIIGFGAWLHVLRKVPLSLAFNVTQGTFLLVPLGGRFFLHETVSPGRWLGIGIVFAGVLLLVPELVKAEADEAPGSAKEKKRGELVGAAAGPGGGA